MKYCGMCFKNKNKKDFYEGFRECKKCTGDWLDKQSNEKAFKNVKTLLKSASYVVNEELLMEIFFSEKDVYRELSNSNRLSEYMRKINNYPQYKEYRYNVLKISEELPNYMDYFAVEEKSDIDFINDDIKELKIKISNALQKEDFNAHNKWMNSLRDALELRDKLQGNKDCIINIGTIMVKDETDINKLSEELSKITKRNRLD